MNQTLLQLLLDLTLMQSLTQESMMEWLVF